MRRRVSRTSAVNAPTTSSRSSTAYREGTRTTDEAYGNAMRQVANGLTDTEIKALASYIQGLH